MRCLIPVLVCATLCFTNTFAQLPQAPPGQPGVPFQSQAGHMEKGAVQERLNRVRTAVFSGAGRIDESIQELKAILALDPRSAEAHLLLGIAYRSLGSAELMAEAKAELRQALALDPALVPARLYLAHVYLDFGQAKSARDELNTALAQLPGHPQFMALLGESERRMGNPRRSVEVNLQVLQADESFAQARYYLSLALLDLGRHDEAIQELERVVRSGVEQADVFLSLGGAYLETNRSGEASTILRRGVQIDPSRSDLRIQLARAYRASGLLDEAEQQLKLAAPDGGAALASPYYQYQQMESDFYLELGLVQMDQGRLEAAAQAFQKVLERDPDHGPTNRHLAEVYLLQGFYTPSLKHADRAEELGFPLPEDKRRLLRERLPARKPGGQE